MSTWSFFKSKTLARVLFSHWIYWSLVEFCPLLFWAPESIDYLNNTLVGLLIIVFTFQFLTSMQHQNQDIWIPKDWSFNPSSWSHRIPVIFLAVICWFLARYLDSFELGYYAYPWDPVFGDGTLKVLSSKIFRSFPVPDAGLGAL